MHGLFFLDFLADMPWRDPYDYVQRYAAQYPALAFNWYLPLFPVFMGAVMSIAGTSEMAAHTAVLALWLPGVVALYAWLASRVGRAAALLAAVTLLTAFGGSTVWDAPVMLEAPSVGLCALSVWAFQRYLDRPAHLTAISAGLFLFTTVMVKQTTLFILPTLLVYALVSQTHRSSIWRRQSLWIVAMVVGALSATAVHAILFGPAAVMSADTPGHQGAPSLLSAQRWLMYARSIYLGVGPVVAAMAVLGLMLSVQSPAWSDAVLPLAWLVSA